jgi:enamine deaminase RidA (YjgF/YER057c/UK114 family)
VNIYTTLEQKNITLPNVPVLGGNYSLLKQSNNQIFVSGQTPKIDGVLVKKGKLGSALTVEEGYQLTCLCTLNAIAALHAYTGDLNHIAKFVKLTVFVSSEPSFFNQAQVANGATDLLVELFGTGIGCPARSAVGVAVLPGDAPCEVEMIVELKNL